MQPGFEIHRGDKLICSHIDEGFCILHKKWCCSIEYCVTKPRPVQEPLTDPATLARNQRYKARRREKERMVALQKEIE